MVRNDLSTQQTRTEVISVYREVLRALMLLVFNADVDNPVLAQQMLRDMPVSQNPTDWTEFGGMYEDVRNMAEKLASYDYSPLEVSRWTGTQ